METTNSSEGEWAELTALYPQYIYKNDWKDLSPEELVGILSDHPEFADHCEQWDSFTGADWMNLLIKQPDFSDECQEHSGFEKLDGKQWASLLSVIPDFVDDCVECDAIQKLDGDDWFNILSTQGDVVDIRAACCDCDGWHKMETSQLHNLWDECPELQECFAEFIGIQP